MTLKGLIHLISAKGLRSAQGGNNCKIYSSSLQVSIWTAYNETQNHSSICTNIFYLLYMKIIECLLFVQQVKKTFEKKGNKIILCGSK